jgi:hypothetical protein
MQERLPRVQGGIKACHPWQLDSGIPCRNDELCLNLGTLVRGLLPSLGGFG